MKRTLGVAVIGCGHIAPKHVEAIRATPGLELRAICDIDPAKRRVWAEKLAVPGFADIKDVLARKEIDIVSICTPNYLHVPMARAALALGKHAVVEKPVALSSAEAIALDRAFLAAGLSLFVVLQVRFNPAVLAVADVVRAGGLGRLYLASLAQRWNRRDDYFASPGIAGADNWHGVKALEGGALFTQGVHYIDLLLELAGPIAEVSATTRTLAHAIETEDAAVAHLVFRSGALGTLEFTLDVYEKNLEASLSLFGETGSIVLGGPAANEIALWNVKDHAAPEGLAVVAPNDYGGAYVGSPPNHGAIYANVATRLIDGTEQVAVTAASAARSIIIIEAIYESALTGRPVRIWEAETR
jgi:UDP-N-acetyl-2-amino-2-deoxyglucuronate dehydrogenase